MTDYADDVVALHQRGIGAVFQRLCGVLNGVLVQSLHKLSAKTVLPVLLQDR